MVSKNNVQVLDSTTEYLKVYRSVHRNSKDGIVNPGPFEREDKNFESWNECERLQEQNWIWSSPNISKTLEWGARLGNLSHILELEIKAGYCGSDAYYGKFRKVSSNEACSEYLQVIFKKEYINNYKIIAIGPEYIYEDHYNFTKIVHSTSLINPNKNFNWRFLLDKYKELFK